MRKGKSCNVYDFGETIVLEYTNRLSAFDKHVCEIRDKGKNLAAINSWWMNRTNHIIPNHFMFQNDNIFVGRKCRPIMLEIIVRGYMTGSLWKKYQSGAREYCGVSFPDGLTNFCKLDQPIITPTTKSDNGDMPISAKEIIDGGMLTREQWNYISEKALQLFDCGSKICLEKGLILVDTKYEFGFYADPDNQEKIILIDEIHTCDSSRFWEAADYKFRVGEGNEPSRIDKDIVRTKLLNGDITDDVKESMAKAYEDFYKRLNTEKTTISKLRYGCNPHQIGYVEYDSGKWQILNGDPGYINWLDAINAWSLVSDIEISLKEICVASFKHNSPAGVAIRTKSDETLQEIFLKCRYIDPKSSFGDFVAVNRCVDVATAKQLKKFVSDGIVAPDFEEEALDILRSKKGSKYVIIKAKCEPHRYYNNHYCMEERKLGSVTLCQDYNSYIPRYTDILSNITSDTVYMSWENARDLVLANITCKWAISNSVVVAVDGQAIGIAAGQQSRIDCVKLACQKALLWKIRKTGACELSPEEQKECKSIQEKINKTVTKAESIAKFCGLYNVDNIDDIVMASDGFFPFTDNIDVAHQHKVKYIVHPGGSTADQLVRDKCNEYGIVLVESGRRIFNH